ncbi:dihydrofolate reductase [Corallibacter sp.]|uniref:dihydrofolate reductase n=1 Tax=Corallibacter sp. TaxID=2038084 RepID=UPI003AB39418
MFGKKKQTPQIDKEQLELIKTAQKRIKQKKRLYAHFIIFIIGAIFLILANTVLGIGENIKPLGVNWFVYAILFWLLLFVYHVFNVFVTSKFLSEKWEQKQLDKLVAQQKERINELKDQLLAEETIIAKREVEKELQAKKKTNKNAIVTLIVAAGEDNAIGKDNDLIWHLSDDLKRFKSLTNGHHIIMGRKTFESFPKPLPNRNHIVITRQSNYQAPEGVIIVNSLEDALDAARLDEQPYIIGGGEIYKQAMPLANKIELTRVHGTFDGADTFFPVIDKTIWKETNNVFHDKDDKHQFSFSFLTYERF